MCIHTFTGALQTETTEAPAQVVANSTETPAATSDEDRIASSTPPSSSTSENATPSPSSETDNRETEDTSIRRGSGMNIEGIVGIAVGCLAVIALAIAFVRAGSSKRKQAEQQQHGELLTAVQDLASSTMSVKDGKYIESLDSSNGPPGSPRTSTIAAIRKPTAPHTHHRLQGGGSMYTTTAGSKPSGSATPAALVQQASAQAAAATIIDVDDQPKPSRVVRTFSRSQRSGSGHDALKKAPLSPESYLKFAQSGFRQARRSSRHSRAMESPNPNATSSSSAASPVPPPQRSRMRFSRRGSLHTTPSNEDDSAADIPMLGGGGILARSSNSSSQNDPTSPRDIPVLARGSEESVDSVEDDDIEISI